MPIHIMHSTVNETVNTDGIANMVHSDEPLGLSRTVGRPRDRSCLVRDSTRQEQQP